MTNLLLKLKSKVKAFLQPRKDEGYDAMGWNEFLRGGFDILPAETIEYRMNQTVTNPYYKELLAQGTRVLGIWDDNDFGVNDGRSDNPMKNEQKLRFLSYIGEDNTTERYLRTASDPERGIEEHYQLTNGKTKARLILPDLRFYYTGDEMLGE